MKLKHFLILLAISVIAYMTGATFKIMHWPHAETVILVSWIAGVIAVLGILLKIISHPRVKEFINK